MPEHTTTPAALDYGGQLRRCPGENPVGSLSVAEVDVISRQIGCNATHAAVHVDHPQHMPALARVAWLWERKSNPTAQLGAFLALTTDQVYALVGMLDPDDAPAAADDDLDVSENPTVSTRG